MRNRTVFTTVAALFAAAVLMLASCSRTALDQGYPGNSRRENRRLAAELSSVFKKIEVTPKDDLRFYSELSTWLGTPYRYGGNSRRGADCSGFVGSIYADLGIATLERTVSGMYSRNVNRISRGRLRTGDLVFFRLRSHDPVSHVGIYLKDGWFIHASSSRGVIVSSLDEEYYEKNFYKGGRITTGWKNK